MSDAQRVQRLLEKMLDSNLTPEEACVSDPDLLRAVRERWEQLRRVGHQLDALFPAAGPTDCAGETRPPSTDQELPHIDGYDVQAVLGRGGVGVVFRARDLTLKRLVALKMLLAGPYAGPLELGRFRREAEAVAALRHPHIVQVYEVGDLAGQPYFTMEYVEGGSLSQHLEAAPLPPRRAAELLAQLASAVQFAHQSGIIHRDLKPANILIAADGTPKITDFGLARPMEGVPEFTLSGVRLGTPSYMAPEQALGMTSAVGPAADVYALGGVLYETLTGRPPFIGESVMATELKVIGEEPTPPSRHNPHVPRDLATICLKCLQKNPARRYASAQDLADDLHRFLDGKPVLARPVGLAHRVAKWARRRPALATLAAALVLLLGLAAGAGVWLAREESARQAEAADRQWRARQAIQAAVGKAYASGRKERWQEAGLVLAEAARHQEDADSEELHSLLERVEADLRFVQRLSHIRHEAAALVAERFVLGQTDHNLLLATEYASEFRQAGYNLDEDADRAAARIRTSPFRNLTLAALDRWALAAFLLKREPLQKQLLHVARAADTDDGWRARFRDPAIWRDKNQLLQLADDAPRAANPPAAHQLAITATLLAQVGAKSEGTRLLREALHRRPDDVWLHWEMGVAYERDRKHRESVPYFRTVVALRPDNPWTTNRLACALVSTGEFDEGIALIRRALELSPRDENLRRNVVIALIFAGRSAEAIAEGRRLVESEPENADDAFTLGTAYTLAGRHAESIPWYQKAVALDPGSARAHYSLGAALAFTGRLEDAVLKFRETFKLEKGSVKAHHGLSMVLQMLGRHGEAVFDFQWLLRHFDLKKQRGESDPGDGVDPIYLYAQHRIVRSLLALGRFAEAAAAAEKALTLPQGVAGAHAELREHLAFLKQLVPVEKKLQVTVAGLELPADLATRQALAEWCSRYGRQSVAAVRLYEGVFRAQPALAEDLNSRQRYYAACAAARAGTAPGDGGTQVDEPTKAVLRERALEWLRADWGGWVRRYRTGDRAAAAQAVREWEQSADLTGVRDTAELAKLPEGERQRWQQLWAEVKELAARDPILVMELARAHVARKEWARAAAHYAKICTEVSTTRGEIWFEYAAVQLLLGDVAGYRGSCKRMLEGAPSALQLRSYLVARACTLAPDSVEDPALPELVSKQELEQFRTTFWSRTEQGALHHRAKRYEEAIRMLDRSIQAESRPGAAVLNWLWLALTYQKLGDVDEARRWLDRAVVFLDAQGDELPANADALNLHVHNWLEAHILRQEAERLLPRVRE
jgi:serine/threonine-protein kinase